MAHELDFSTGRAAMAYTGSTPWHGLGTQLEKGAPIEEWAEAAGMNWNINRAFVRYFTDRQQTDQRILNDKVVLHRSDNGNALGVVSADYKPVQPREVLQFFEDLVASAGFHLSTAGVLRGGKRFWAMAEVANPISIGGDQVRGNLLLATGCDGTLATTAKLTAVRVVCNNTLTAATAKDSSSYVKIKHNIQFDAAEVRDKLAAADEEFRIYMNRLAPLAERRVTDEEVKAVLDDLLKGQTTRADMTKSKPYVMIDDLFRGGAIGSDRHPNTAWQLLNAVTEYVDHHARARSTDNRMDTAWFGRGDDLKTEAVERIMQLVTV